MKNILSFLLVIIVIICAYLLYQHRNNTIMNDSSQHELVNGVSLDIIEHASAILTWNETVMYNDPVGDPALYERKPHPDVIVITHRHADHFDLDTLNVVSTENTILIVPQDIADQLPETILGEVVVLKHGNTYTYKDLTFEAVPAYNIREEALMYHPKERGDNGYLISDGTSRIYFSGDSGPTEEMKRLTDIDVAFVAMNLPYTMSVETAAEAVTTFAPRRVYPYHYRTPEGFSDVAVFKHLVESSGKDIEVVQLEWYPNKD